MINGYFSGYHVHLDAKQLTWLSKNYGFISNDIASMFGNKCVRQSKSKEPRHHLNGVIIK